MATTKPRITITLTHRQHEVLKAISDNSGQSMSAFVSEILEQSLPVLERMAESFRKIKSAQDEQRKRIAEELDQAQNAVEPILAQVIGQFDLFMGKVETAAGVSGDTALAGADGERSAAQTPATNRGVTPTPAKSPKASPRKELRVSAPPKVFPKKKGV